MPSVTCSPETGKGSVLHGSTRAHCELSFINGLLFYLIHYNMFAIANGHGRDRARGSRPDLDEAATRRYFAAGDLGALIRDQRKRDTRSDDNGKKKIADQMPMERGGDRYLAVEATIQMSQRVLAKETH